MQFNLEIKIDIFVFKQIVKERDTMNINSYWVTYNCL